MAVVEAAADEAAAQVDEAVIVRRQGLRLLVCSGEKEASIFYGEGLSQGERPRIDGSIIIDGFHGSLLFGKYSFYA